MLHPLLKHVLTWPSVSFITCGVAMVIGHQVTESHFEVEEIWDGSQWILVRKSLTGTTVYQGSNNCFMACLMPYTHLETHNTNTNYSICQLIIWKRLRDLNK